MDTNFLKELQSYKRNTVEINVKAIAVYENKIWLGNLCAQYIARNLCEQNMAQKFMRTK